MNSKKKYREFVLLEKSTPRKKRLSDPKLNFFGMLTETQFFFFLRFIVSITVERTQLLALESSIDFVVVSNAYHFQKLGIILSRS